MASQKLKITRLENKNSNVTKEISVISKASIGTMYLNGIPYSYNLEETETHQIDFDDIEKQMNYQNTIYVRRK